MPKVLERFESRSNYRYVVGLSDGNTVESVLYRGDTLCVSCQVGCAVRCPFCASGKDGLGRHLTDDEMMGQVDAVMADLAAERPGVELGGIQRVTVSGIGEPLHNHQAVTRFALRCRERRLWPSLTTSGGPLHHLSEWLSFPHNGLTISVHAGTEVTRKRMVPHGPPLGELFALLEEKLPTLTNTRRKKLSLAYLLVAGQNDSDQEIEAFLDQALRTSLTVHLFAYNPVPHSPFERIPEERYQAIYEQIKKTGLYVRMSSKARTEPNGGCGTLVALRRDRRKSVPDVPGAPAKAKGPENHPVESGAS